MIPLNEFRKNQSRFPLEELEKYNGKYVAWSDDGTHILTSDKDESRVYQWLCDAGYNPGEILISYVSVPEDISWGGIQIIDEGEAE